MKSQTFQRLPTVPNFKSNETKVLLIKNHLEQLFGLLREKKGKIERIYHTLE